MKFTCNTADLKRACDTAKRAVSGKTSLAVLEGLLLRCELNNEDTERLCVIGYDLEVGIQTSADTRVREAGDCVLDAALFCGILGKIASDDVSVEVDQRGKVIIRGGDAEFKLSAMPGKDFPELPSAGNDHSVSVQLDLLQAAIRGTAFAASTVDGSKPIHTGVLFDVAEGAMTLAAIDGFRLATRHITIGYKGEPVQFVVPPKALKEILGVKDDGYANVQLSKRHITFDIGGVGGVQITSRLLDGQFMNYRAAIPQAFAMDIRVRTGDILAAVERVSLVNREKVKIPSVMHLNPDDGSILISCKTGTGEAQERVSVEGCKQAMRIGFNHRYLADALSACDDSTVVLRINEAVSPVVISPVEGEGYMHMVLPVRLKEE